MQSIHFKHELKAMDEMTARREYFFADLIKATSVIYGEPVSALVGDRRDRRMTRLRWRCFWLGRIELGLTYTQIGTLFRRDHTTIMHGVTKYDDLAEEAGEREAREQLKETATAIARGELTREAADDQPQ